MHVSELIVYPIKGCAGISVTALEVDAGGIRHDRRWMVVDPAGRFLSQRKIPTLARVTVHAVEGAEGEFEIRSVDSPRRARIKPPPEGLAETFEVWSHTRLGVEYLEGSHWFSDLFKTPLRLVYAPPQAGEAFHDAAQALVISEASLASLNERLPRPIPMSRFRPNIVLSGPCSHAEDTWTTLKTGEVDWLALERCGRCTVTTIDQITGEKTGLEPLKTLATYRSFDNEVCFGMYYALEQAGTIRVHDTIGFAD